MVAVIERHGVIEVMLDGIAAGLGSDGTFEFLAVCSIKAPPYDGAST